MQIRLFNASDWPQCVQIIRNAFASGDTYPYPPDMPEEETRSLWVDTPRACYVAEDDQLGIIGTYYIKANQASRGSHVCNCGYIVDEKARGKGVATAMCLHSQQEAVRLGFTAMQFNLVVATNVGAVHLWQKLGFAIIGTLPAVFRHETLGLVNAHVMFKTLEPNS
jgi:RimJ/RimL family protein N-acetyltransferase